MGSPMTTTAEAARVDDTLEGTASSQSVSLARTMSFFSLDRTTVVLTVLL